MQYHNRNKKRKRKGTGKKHGFVMLVLMLCFGISTGQLKKQESSLVAAVAGEVKRSAIHGIVKNYMPGFYYGISAPETDLSAWEYLSEKMLGLVPVYGYVKNQKEYETPPESELSYETILRLEALDENYIDEATGELMFSAVLENEAEVLSEAETENAKIREENETAKEKEEEKEEAAETKEEQAVESADENTQKQVTYPREKLNDFDYLIQNFYTVDRTTTIDSSQLVAEQLLAKDLSLKTENDKPQILIYHTHSQEMYIDSTPGDLMTGIMGCGEYLTQILTEKYGLNVIHHMGQYDVPSRDSAYANAAPAIEQILAENPSIEVVIDLHRDAVPEDVHMVRTVQGVQMAPIMFFNGLSRLADTGAIDYLKNPYIEDNLAFSLQMKLAASEYYPDLTRNIYLKGYRYNMHYCPKTLLVELGAQTNTFEEAKNAMAPLADLLNKVLCE